MKTGESISGFKLVRKGKVAEINSRALIFRHEVTGAEVLSLENGDDNKVFSVTFRTPPENDRGVAHILEHSVLCGSRKYPVKEPFIELVKGSLQTFLNAMTFPDKTMYPVASRNMKDFFNLMNVYLDAVLFPRITEEIFKQEGWHHELEDPEGEVTYKGVVYNEMKGVFSNPESLIERHLAHSLFPSTTYGHESGGDPEAIPDLTYEEFREFHRKFYHPGNSRIFLYGDHDTRQCLEFMQENYLKEFRRRNINSAIKFQRRFKKLRHRAFSYAVSSGESLEKKAYVLIGWKMGRATDREHCLGNSILSYLLLGTAASPLRKALIDSGLGSEVIGGGFDDNRAETLFAVGLKGTEPEHEGRILELIESTLRGLVENGIDRDMILSAVNSVDFKLREANFGGFAKGIVYNIQALNSWLYDADPLMHLKYDRLMKKIKDACLDGYFEALIEKGLLKNDHRSILLATPEPGLAKAQEERMREKLKALKASLSGEELTRMASDTAELKALQMTPDSAVALATLPTLDLDDIPREGEKFPLEIKRDSAPKILFHDLFTSQIAYMQVGFNTHTVSQDKIQYLPLLATLTLGMGTKKSNYVDMSKKIGIHTGGIRPWHFTSATVRDRRQVLSYVFFSGKALMEKLDALFDIYTELFADRSFHDHKRLVDLIRSAKSDMEDSIIPHGNQFVLARLQSHQSPLGVFDELTDGITYFRFLEDLLKRAEKDPAEVAAAFGEVAKCVFTRGNALFNITAEADDYTRFEPRINSLAEALPGTPAEPVKLRFDLAPRNEGFLSASTVQYVGKGANLYDLGYEYTGSFNVLKSLLGTSYLWEKVRMQGGAYGSSNSFDFLTGDYGLVSYRDPNLKETLDIYDRTADHLAHLDLTGDELKKVIIGCIGSLDPPLTPDRKGSVSMIEHLTGKDWDLKQKHRQQLLGTTLKDIRKLAGLFETLRDSGTVCVLGNEEKLKQSKALFDELSPLFH
jgi:Zn-dependent M16 (insulinase) family peptidase